MPRLNNTPQAPATRVEFVASPVLDMVNAMFFTSLVPQMDGVDGWPERLRGEMAPDLLADLDFLYTYPAADPGIMGVFGDNLFAHPECWGSVESLVRYLRAMPPGDTGSEADPGIQGLIYQATFRYPEEAETAPYRTLPPGEAIERRMRDLGDRDAGAIMSIYGRPEELRERMGRLIERFFDEHYREEMPQRLPSLERSVAAHRDDTGADPAQLMTRLTGRPTSCLEGGGFCEAGGPYRRLIFTPSLDMGPYNSCAIVDGIHGLYYACEPQFRGAPAEAQETERTARIFKALGDEQRLRILRLLREREMYAQEIVERTRLHQSVVSRHLAFMKAVGLVRVRRQNNMKFFSLNPAMREELQPTLDLFPAAPAS